MIMFDANVGCIPRHLSYHVPGLPYLPAPKRPTDASFQNRAASGEHGGSRGLVSPDTLSCAGESAVSGRRYLSTSMPITWQTTRVGRSISTYPGYLPAFASDLDVPVAIESAWRPSTSVQSRVLGTNFVQFLLPDIPFQANKGIAADLPACRLEPRA